MALAPARKRKCGPKVKSGCLTCKIRRVKCDEAKPACLRCTSTGRKCDGYIKDIMKSNSASNQGLVLVQQVSALIPGSTEERRGFSYYLNKTAPELTGYYDSSFWEKLLIQAAVGDASLRHAVIGIGSLHEAFADKRLDYSADKIERGFAINQYTKAIGHLRRSLATGSQQPLTALMSCILFVCFDSIRGHFASALVHLQSGLKILRDLRTSSAADEHIIAKNLAPAFLRLSVQAILYIDAGTTSDRQGFAIEMTEMSERETEIKDTFSTLEEARDTFNQAANGLFGMFYTYDPDLPYSAHKDTFHLHMKYTSKLAAWNKAFERYMQTNNSKLNTKDIRGAAMLKVQHTTASIMANCSYPDANDPRPIAEVITEPGRFDKFIGDFETIVTLSRSLIAASEEDSLSGKSPFYFSADLGIIGPLYYVCVKCPDEKLRLAAIELLRRCPRREGMWDSTKLVQLIRGFWAIEASQEALQTEIVNEKGEPISLSILLDLVFKDGMKWEWRWRDVALSTRQVVPRQNWSQLLADQSSPSIQEIEDRNQ